ncbi:MAG: discoidin domain-containing protein [Armatimonadetes bacterium]|nr:discoidin domain-containing protein [Armatimonadota bacterium]
MHAPVPASTGALVTADSSHDGYSPGVLIDGTIDVEGLHWTRQAWASADRSEPHWIEISFPQVRQIGAVQIYWSVDGGRPWTSRKFTVFGLTDAGPVTLAEVSQEGDHSFTEHAFAPTEVKGLRIEQAAGDGPAARPNIMWVREVAAFPR